MPGQVYNGSKEVDIFTSEEAERMGKKTSFIETVFKVIACFTIVIPAIMLMVKAIFRRYNKFHMEPTEQILREGIEITPEI